MAEELTEDTLLDGRVRLIQPRRGYRVAIDPVILAAAVPASSGEVVLDAGAGTGAASLCLAARVPDCRIVGLERERTLQRLASDNVAANGFAPRVEMLAADLGRPPPRVVRASFDHVMTNPPHLAAEAATTSAEPTRAAAHVEAGLDLQAWLAGCLSMLKPDGRLTLIHRADRLAEILGALDGKIGQLVVFPLWPSADARPAKRVLIAGRKGSKAPLRLLPGLVLHEADGRFSPAAEAVLRHGRALDLTR